MAELTREEIAGMWAGPELDALVGQALRMKTASVNYSRLIGLAFSALELYRKTEAIECWEFHSPNSMLDATRHEVTLWPWPGVEPVGGETFPLAACRAIVLHHFDVTQRRQGR